MTFLNALRTGRPMRRLSTWAFCSWRHLGESASVGGRSPVWRFIDTGEVRGMTREDYEADDWEVIP